MKKLFLLLFVLGVTAFSQNEKIKDILILQDQRNPGKLIQYLKDEDAGIAKRAAIALANIQDTTVIPDLITSLNDTRPDVSIASAFALGQMGKNKNAEEALINKLNNCKDDNINSKILEALGKTGSKNAFNIVLKFLTANENVLSAKLEAIATFAYRNISSPESTDFLIETSKNTTDRIKGECAFALFRSKNPELISKYSGEILALLKNEDTYTKMWTASLIGTQPIEKVFEEPLWACLENSDWKVQVNVLKTLEKYPLSDKHLNFAIKKIDDENEHISLAAIKYFKNAKLSPYLSYSKVFNKLISIIENTGGKYSFRQQGESAITFSGLAIDKNDAIKFIKPLLKSRNTRLKAKAIQALAETGSKEALNILLNTKSSDPLIPTNIIESISKLCSKVKITASQEQKIKNLFEISLKQKDMAVITTTAGVLADSVFKNLIPAKTLINTFNQLKTPDDIEPMTEIIKTLGEFSGNEVIAFLEKALTNDDRILSKESANSLKKITGKSYEDKITANTKAGYSDYDWKYLTSLKDKNIMVIKTERGIIKVRLNPDEAPFTVLSFCKLIDKKFFDGLVFHRVVSNFVIQGGDPRGDGWGGPGYAIRTEIGLTNYKRGSVGVASAGKDTEGCQFFITHSPQLHLNGRYTIFGEVIEGMEIADKIQEGDKIISIDRL
jgi:cyclophilin family peptidyl-prolyl cis-trans isomerase/HEAT repeat protein